MEAIAEAVVKAPIYLAVICQVLGAIALVATVVVRVTPSPEDDKKVSKLVAKLWGLIDMLPTVGVNPRTKKIREAIKSLKQ